MDIDAELAARFYPDPPASVPPYDRALAARLREERRRDGNNLRFYRSAAWRRVRAEVLGSMHMESLLELSGSPARVARADTVHHILRLDRYPGYALHPWALDGEGRILRGPEPCGWCFMLAAKGFEYNSAEAASHSHRGCRCVVVPGDSDGTIEGYDLDGMRGRYDSVVSALPPGATKDDIVAALELRDPGWLYDGRVMGFDIPTAKLTRYALCRTNTNGGAQKARAFKKYLGFEIGDWREVARQVYDWVSKEPPIPSGSGDWGLRFTTSMVVIGNDDKQARVKVGWIKRPGESGYSLTTIYVDE